MAQVFLIPSILSEEGIDSIHPYTLDAVRKCQVFFTESQRTTRRFLKQLWKRYAAGEEIIIDEFEWFDMDDSAESLSQFKKKIRRK